MTHITYTIGLDYKYVEFERTNTYTDEVFVLKFSNGGRFEVRDLTTEEDDFEGDIFVVKNRDGTDGSRLSLISTVYHYRAVSLVSITS